MPTFLDFYGGLDFLTQGHAAWSWNVFTPPITYGSFDPTDSDSNTISDQIDLIGTALSGHAADASFPNHESTINELENFGDKSRSQVRGGACADVSMWRSVKLNVTR